MSKDNKKAQVTEKEVKDVSGGADSGGIGSSNTAGDVTATATAKVTFGTSSEDHSKTTHLTIGGSVGGPITI